MISSLGRKCILSLLFFTCIFVIVPFSPYMPTTGLDPSWKNAVNHGVAQGLIFGQDLVFTFGPYASLYTKVFHPATDHLMLLSGAYLSLGYILVLLGLSRGLSTFRLIITLFVFIVFMNSRDALFIIYPFLVATAVYRESFIRYPSLYLAALFSPFGILCLVKGSLLPLMAGITLLSFIYLMYLDKKRLALSVILSPCVTLAFFWCFSGQPINALPSYFTHMSFIISGYSEAMAHTWHIVEVIIYLTSALCFLVFLALEKTSWSSKLFYILCCGLYFFVAFKLSFVRHGNGHAIVCAVVLLFAGLFIPFKEKWNLAIVIAVLSCAWITWTHAGNLLNVIVPKTINMYANGIAGLQTRLTQPNVLLAQYHQQVESIHAMTQIPKMEGSTDIYSHHQSDLLASDNTWSPRPVFQSYAAYTPELIRLNHEYLLSEGAPDNIVFKMQPIGARLPAIEDGLSLPTLLNSYSLIDYQNNYLYFVKKAKMNSAPMMSEILNGHYQFNEEVNLPNSSGIIFAEIDVKPNLLGRLLFILYKPTILEMTLTSEDGTESSYRYISGMGKTGFILSPHLKTSKDLIYLTADVNYLLNRQVRSFRIKAFDKISWGWNPEYDVRLSLIELPVVQKNDQFLKVGHFIDNVPEGSTLGTPVYCEAVIDSLNDMTPPPSNLRATTLLSLQGWVVISTHEGTVPEAVYATLTDPKGKMLYLKADKTRRNDVKLYFKHPTMSDPGYDVFADVSDLSGEYTLGLSYLHAGELVACKQFSIPVNMIR